MRPMLQVWRTKKKPREQVRFFGDGAREKVCYRHALILYVSVEKVKARLLWQLWKWFAKKWCKKGNDGDISTPWKRKTWRWITLFNTSQRGQQRKQKDSLDSQSSCLNEGGTKQLFRLFATNKRGAVGVQRVMCYNTDGWMDGRNK